MINHTEYNPLNSDIVALWDVDDPIRSEDADLRILSFNILEELWADIAPGTLLEYQKRVPTIIRS